MQAQAPAPAISEPVGCGISHGKALNHFVYGVNGDKLDVRNQSLFEIYSFLD
jgi:hypothetical protein